MRFELDGGEHKSFAASAMEMRFLRGQPLTGELPERDTASDEQREHGISADHVPQRSCGGMDAVAPPAPAG